MNQAVPKPLGAEQTSFAGSQRFTVLSVVGQGSAGVVYEVFDRERNERLALKTLRTQAAEAILLLKNEFRAAQELRHPNLVRLHELFELEGQWFFTMDFVHGEDFLAHVRAISGSPANMNGNERYNVQLDDARLRSLFGQLAHGLYALHAAGRVHRDIKPSNVLVTDQGRVVIVDFGIAMDLTRSSVREDGMVGTILYMAPEQAMGGATVSPAADWYAFGVMLYQALTGRMPFVGLSGDVLERKLTSLPSAPSELASGIPEELSTLCMELLRIEPSERPSGATVLERLAVTGDVEAAVERVEAGVFVGRNQELRELERAFADARGHAGVTILVHGESGVGKSFLVRQFSERAATLWKSQIFRGRCYERESVPYKAVDGIVDDLSVFLCELPQEEVAVLVPPNAELLCRVFPVLETVPALSGSRPSIAEVNNPKEQRLRVFTALRDLLDNMARRWPIVLVVDDLQWADADSLALLAHLTRPPAPSILLLGTQRIATEVRKRVHAGELESTKLEGDVRHVYLDPLPPEDARALVVQLLGQDESDSVIQDIAREAKGHPLFIDELIRGRGARNSDRPAPLRLDEAVWQRVGRLELSARQLLEVVAVAGMPLPQYLAAESAGLDAGQALTLVSTLRGANFVRTTGVKREDTIEPYHDRVRESVLAHLTQAERATWHGRLAHVLERAGQADPETLVTHWIGAGEPRLAAEHAPRGAQKAEVALAFDQAVRLYQLALELAPPPPAEARNLRLKLAEALVNSGRGLEAAEVYLELAKSGDAAAAHDARRRAAEEYLCSGHFEQGEAVIRDVLTGVGESYPKTHGAALASVIYSRLVLRMRGFDFARRDAASIAPEVTRRLDALGSAAVGFAMTDPVRGVCFHLRNTRACLAQGDPLRVARALANMTIGTGSAGGPTREQTATQLSLVHEWAKTIPHDPLLSGLMHAVKGFAHYFVGEWDAAREGLFAAEVVFREQCLGASYELNATRLVLVRNQILRGELRDVAARFPAYLREADQKRDLYASVGMRSNPAYLLALLDGNLTLAEEALSEAESHLPPKSYQLQHLYCQTGRVNIDLYRGEAASAHQRWLDTWPKAKRGLLFTVQVTKLFAHDQRARAALALACVGSTPDAKLLRAVEADISGLMAVKLPWARALALLLQSGVCAARRDAHAALEAATAATTELERGGMHFHAAIARRRQGQLLGGSAGAQLVRDADAWLKAQGVREPERVAAVFAPARTSAG